MIAKSPQIDESTVSTSSETRLGTSYLLDKIGVEILDLSETADDLQITISEAMSQEISRDHLQKIASLQELDRVSQTLRALSRLTSSLSKLDAHDSLSEPEVIVAVGLESVSSRILSNAIETTNEDIWL